MLISLRLSMGECLWYQLLSKQWIAAIAGFGDSVVSEPFDFTSLHSFSLVCLFPFLSSLRFL